MSVQRTYIAIDLKAFYASVECMERGLDPMTTNLVVADTSRTEKTICLAVSPSLKAYGISGRARLFEVIQRVNEVNAERLRSAPGRVFLGSSFNDMELKSFPSFSLDYLIAAPQMARYMQVSTEVYQVYLKYIAPEDIHVYSIDEVFMDVTNYLNIYKLSPRDLAMKIILDVLETTGITATAGIGPNLYLSKVAMDIMAKHIQPDKNGVRIAELDELSYRRNFWTHEPITDFWRVGPGYARKLAEQSLYTMGDIACCSIGKPGERYNEDLLYKLFGVNAELLIDHAWGWEPCTIADIKAYKPQSNSIGSGQVLHCPYTFEKAQLIAREMADALSLDLVDKGLVTDQVVLTVGYDIENLKDPAKRKKYHGDIKTDRYGRAVPKHATGTTNLGRYTSSTRQMIEAVVSLYNRIVDPELLIRRVNVTANHVIRETDIPCSAGFEQLDLFTDYAAEKAREESQQASDTREKKMQQAMLSIKKKYGKNAILKGMNYQEGATARERNEQIGGHKK